jgi:hypothetical protein
LNLHEQEFVRSFVQRTRSERVELCLSNPKHRRKFTEMLDHHGQNVLDCSQLRDIEPAKQNAHSIHALLTKLGAPDVCHIMSVNGAIDGRDMQLLAALEQVVGYGMGTVISCIPGKLAYFEGEVRERFILMKK